MVTKKKKKSKKNDTFRKGKLDEIEIRVSITKVLLEHSYAHLLRECLGPLSCYKSRVE